MASLAVLRASLRAALGTRPFALTSMRPGRLVPYKLTDIGEGIREVTVKEWFVQPGDKVQQFDNICEVQSDKASVTITSRYDGTVKSLNYKIDDVALVGSALLDIELDGEAPDKEDDQEAQEKQQPTTNENSEPIKVDTTSEPEEAPKFSKVLTTPAVRRIAMENKIDLRRVRATGKEGRVLKEDILAYLQGAGLESEAGEMPSPASEVHVPVASQTRGKVYQKHMWKTMTKALEIPHFMYSDECEVSKLVKLRNEIKDDFKSQGISLTYMPFFLKAISHALSRFPELNAWVDEASESFKILKQHNLCFAMDTPGGLVVPNIKNVQDLSIIQIAKELNRIQDLGKKCSIPPSDLVGGTFSFSNIGIIGGTYTKPVILPPQVVIGAIGKVQKLPRFDQHEKVIASNILTVSWAADHRVVDGVTLAKFSNLWKHYVENPYHLILSL